MRSRKFSNFYTVKYCMFGIFLLSNFKSLISKGIAIANTNRNRTRICNIILDVKGMLFSKTSKIIVLIGQIKEIMNTLENGILLNPKGYKTDINPEKMITILVLEFLKSKN